MNRRRLSWLTNNDKGLTFIELILVFAFLSLIIVCTYNYYFFSQGVWNRAQAESLAVQETRTALLYLEKDIKSAQRGPGGEQALQILAEGMGLEVYADVTGDENPELIRYEIYEDGLRRGLIVSENTGEDYWQKIISNLANKKGDNFTPIFSMEQDKIIIDFLIITDDDSITMHPFNIKATFTVRSKDVI